MSHPTSARIGSSPRSSNHLHAISGQAVAWCLLARNCLHECPHDSATSRGRWCRSRMSASSRSRPRCELAPGWSMRVVHAGRWPVAPSALAVPGRLRCCTYSLYGPAGPRERSPACKALQVVQHRLWAGLEYSRPSAQFQPCRHSLVSAEDVRSRLMCAAGRPPAGDAVRLRHCPVLWISVCRSRRGPPTPRWGGHPRGFRGKPGRRDGR